MVFKDGDFLEVEYSVWNASDSRLIATTSADEAKKAGLFSEKGHYGPVLVILGSNGVIKGLDRELRGMEPNQKKKFTFKPEDAFGQRSESLVRVMPLSDFRARDINPQPGMQVNIDDMTAVIKSVNSGRVVVDANHPYAGRNVSYDVTVLRKLNTGNEKILALGDTYNAKPTSAQIKDKDAEILFDEKVRKDADYFVGKASLVASAFNYIGDIDRIVVREEYVRPKAAATGGAEAGKE
jgi:FKBP-type peptidyl-prolyl cis-trans isomerase 2